MKIVEGFAKYMLDFNVIVVDESYSVDAVV